MQKLLPSVKKWFEDQGWAVRPHQRQMVAAFQEKRSTLLIAPTGTGKTMAGFLASIMDIHRHKAVGLHTLYISPLKALTNDVERNLIKPLSEMQLDVRVETRTGDTPSHKRLRQRKNPPHILLTTPESIMLMLSYPDAPQIFGNLKLVVVDEIHSLAPGKRGDFTALALARLATLAPDHIRFGLSATVAEPTELAQWLGTTDNPADIIQVKSTAKPKVSLLKTSGRLPYGGYMAGYAVPEIYAAIRAAQTSIVFVNTRSQCERMFQMLWEANTDGLPIAIYHGSLSKEQRRRTEALMATGKLRAIVATAALELGIDWGDVDLVLNIGAPKGISRLLQRVGRSNHRMNEPSVAKLVPSNHFEVLECQSAIKAIAAGRLDGEPLTSGGLDVVVQYIINCACAGPVKASELFEEVRQARPYTNLGRDTFDRLFRFAVDGGYVLGNYDRYARLVPDEETKGYVLAGRWVASRHRQNIGVIIESARLKVLRRTAKRGRVVGEVEEGFAQGLVRGDTFYFAGEVLAFERVRDMFLEARPAAAKQPKTPSYTGGNMPLSTFLADGVRDLLNDPSSWSTLPKPVVTWLELQREHSRLPGTDHLLVEHFAFQRKTMTVLYTFEGRKANQTLGMLVTRRMERDGLHPLGFSVTDYTLSITGLTPLTREDCLRLLEPDIVIEELEDWLLESPMLKRSFRRVATISGIAEKRNGGSYKTMKQVTFSTDLVYDVLRHHEPDHILLGVARDDAERELLDTARLTEFLLRYHHKVDFMALERPSPLSVPILFDVKRESVGLQAIEALLAEANVEHLAEKLMQTYDYKAPVKKIRPKPATVKASGSHAR